MRVHILGSLAVLFSFLNAVSLSADTANHSLPFTLTPTGQILVHATVNGTGPHTFVLDTGSNRSVLSEALASRLGLAPVAMTETVTSAGSGTALVVRIQTMALGPHTASDVLAPVVPSARLHAIHPEAEGIIGQDVLIDAHYTLDYRRTRITWLAADQDSGAGARLTLRRSEGRVIVEVPQSKDAEDLARLIPDSGASVLVLFGRDEPGPITATPLGAAVKAITLSGDSHMQMATVARLRVGSHTLWDVPAVIVASPGADAQAVHGLLPLSGFSSVTFNGPGHYMVARR
jgi:predicted aspartyl protease